jgi:hypothetical protein
MAAALTAQITGTARSSPRLDSSKGVPEYQKKLSPVFIRGTSRTAGLIASAASAADHSAICSLSTINVLVDNTRLTANGPCLACGHRGTDGSTAEMGRAGGDAWRSWPGQDGDLMSSNINSHVANRSDTQFWRFSEAEFKRTAAAFDNPGLGRSGAAQLSPQARGGARGFPIRGPPTAASGRRTSDATWSTVSRPAPGTTFLKSNHEPLPKRCSHSLSQAAP